MAAEALKSVIQSLPETPGVYKDFDSTDTILYVGKAKNLKKRVSSYFTKQHYENRKTAVLVSKIHRIEFTVVDTELDALLLENSLIKELQPRYNISLKDDKTYPYIRITAERFPRVFQTRQVIRDGSEYFGPYANVKVMQTVLDLAKKLYPTRNCNLVMNPTSIKAGKFRICLEYHIGNCLGPCEGKQSEDNYLENIEQIRKLLKGNLFEVKKHLKSAMVIHAEQLEFEDAQRYKEKLDALDRYQAKSTVISPNLGDLEVYSISSIEKIAFVNFLRVSQGLIVVSRNLEIRKRLEESDEDLLETAIVEMGQQYGDDCREIVLSHPIELSIPGVGITVPKLGEKRKLLELSLKNTLLYKQEKLAQYDKLNPEMRVDRLMEQMKQDLRLKEQPRHIECFDNSNFQGSYPVSAMVCFKNAAPSKKDYRKFNIETVQGINDFASMKEAVYRRYKRQKEEQHPLPQLVIIDGGKGQLSAAMEAITELGLQGTMTLVGLAKNQEELFFTGDSEPLRLPYQSNSLLLIRRIRDEVHRFGVNFHRKQRSKGTFKNQLQEVPGIGAQTATELLQHFRSVNNMLKASSEELAAVVGKVKANKIKAYFSNTP